jgi:signal transduction histidine kinase
VRSVQDDACDWRTLAYAFGSLLTQSRASAPITAPDPNERLVSLVVHELRTPVAIIKAYAELIESQAAAKQPNLNGSREVMAHILEQADLIADWVDAMLEVQRLQLGELPLDLQPLDALRLAWMVAEEIQQTTQRHQVRVVSDSPPPLVLGDRARLRQVLTNLLENAVRYASGGTIEVHVSGEPESARALIAVSDQGPGLEAGERDRIFAPFEQAQRHSVGLGLGLYLSRQIARLHGGDLWAESSGRLQGSTFVLTLPLAR